MGRAAGRADEDVAAADRVAVVADQGIVQSDAYHTLRDRRLLGAPVEIYADVGGKHSTPLAPLDFELQARDLVHRGLADGLVVSGRVTGAPTPLDDLKRVRGATPRVRLLVGSGATPETIAELLSIADGAIVGTSLKQGLADGRIRRDERAVLFNCATGLKYPLPPVHRTLDRLQPIDFAAL